jgi:hypothetical protein
LALITINDDIINSTEAETYFTKSDRRIAIGFRACLELLGIPVPSYAGRRKPGRTPAMSVMTAFGADHVTPRSYQLAPRKPNASPVTPVALAPTAVAGPGLFNETFA